MCCIRYGGLGTPRLGGLGIGGSLDAERNIIAFFGTIIVFTGAYFVEKSRSVKAGRSILHLLSMMPMAIPGLVLGLAYIFFFNHPDNPLNFIYGTMAILVICTITHLVFLSLCTKIQWHLVHSGHPFQYKSYCNHLFWLYFR